MADIVRSLTNMSPEHILKEYQRIKDSVNCVMLPESLQCLLNKNNQAEIPEISSYREDTETLLKFVFAIECGPFNERAIVDLRTIATVHLLHLKTLLETVPQVPVVVGQQACYVSISNECYVKSSFPELVAIYLYKGEQSHRLLA